MSSILKQRLKETSGPAFLIYGPRISNAPLKWPLHLQGRPLQILSLFPPSLIQSLTDPAAWYLNSPQSGSLSLLSSCPCLKNLQLHGHDDALLHGRVDAIAHAQEPASQIIASLLSLQSPCSCISLTPPHGCLFRLTRYVWTKSLHNKAKPHECKPKRNELYCTVPAQIRISLCRICLCRPCQSWSSQAHLTGD